MISERDRAERDVDLHHPASCPFCTSTRRKIELGGDIPPTRGDIEYGWECDTIDCPMFYVTEVIGWRWSVLENRPWYGTCGDDDHNGTVPLFVPRLAV